MLLFQKKTESSQYLNKSNITALNGKYGINAIYSGATKDTTSSWNFSDSNLGLYSTIFDEMDNRYLKKEIVIENNKTYYFTLKILNAKKIKINFIEEDNIIKQKIIRYRLKDDGYIYLKNSNFKIRGIPYVFGDINKKRIRLTLNKDNNLLYETSEFNSGGLFLLMVVPVAKMKYEKIYERME